MILLAGLVGYLFKGIILTKGFAIYFIIQSIICFIIGNIIWGKLVKMKKNHMTDKFKEFNRIDVDLWSKNRIILGITFIFPFRFIALVAIVFSWLVLMSICTVGHDFTKPFTGWRRILFRMSNKISPRLALLAAGYVRINWNKKDDYDYSKWLGKDYKTPEFAVSSTSNHCAWTDIFIMLVRGSGVSFIAKAAIKDIFLFGRGGKAIDTIYFDRNGSHEEKEKLVEQINERQQNINDNKGEGISLHLFAEGLTSNNTHVLPFKRGVFSSLLPVRPIALKYSSSYFNPAHDVMPMSMHLFVLLSQITNSVEVIDLPIFGPNEYLYKNHMKPGEEKWMAYARAIQGSIADVLDLPTSNANLGDKNKCKEAYLGDKVKLD